MYSYTRKMLIGSKQSMFVVCGFMVFCCCCLPCNFDKYTDTETGIIPPHHHKHTCTSSTVPLHTLQLSERKTRTSICFSGTGFDQRLNYIQVPLVDDSLCAQDDWLGHHYDAVRDVSLCAGYADGGPDACTVCDRNPVSLLLAFVVPS